MAALLAALLAASPCPLVGELTPDREAADDYVAVAEAELALGAEDSARAAVCAALEADPTHGRARGLEARLLGPPPSGLDEPLALLRRGAWTEALASLRAPGAPRDETARLLEGLCLLELGRLDEARAPFVQAREAAALRELADFFLGVVELQRGETASAAARLEGLALAHDDRLRWLAADLRRLAKSEGRFTAVGVLLPGFDSNVDATPLADRSAPSAASPDLTAMAALWARPLGRSGPSLRARAQHRALFRVTDFSASTFEAGAGWNQVTRTFRARGEYAFEALWLGGAEYRQSHVLQVAAEVHWRTLSAALLWAGRFQHFAPAALQDFTGFQQTALAQVAWAPVSAVAFWAGWLLAHDAPRATALGYLELGPRLGTELRPAEALRVTLVATPTLRRYAGLDPTLGVRREDLRLEGQLALTWQLLEAVALQAAVAGLFTDSNGARFTFARVTANLGVVFLLGVP